MDELGIKGKVAVALKDLAASGIVTLLCALCSKSRPVLLAKIPVAPPGTAVAVAICPSCLGDNPDPDVTFYDKDGNRIGSTAGGPN